MFANILADLSVLMLAILLFFLTMEEAVVGQPLSHRKLVLYIVATTIVGLLLLQFSVVVDGARFDYRFLLYALVMQYLGAQVALPTIFILTLWHFFFGSSEHALVLVLFGFAMVLTLAQVHRFFAKYMNAYWQLIGLSLYELVVHALINMLVYHQVIYNKAMYLAVSSSGLVIILVLLFIIKKIKKMHAEPYIDYLTKLGNSRRFYLDLNRPYERTTACTIFLLDIDHFKKVNDTYGHLVGDAVLVQVSAILRAYESEHVQMYRIGGEEFAGVLYPGFQGEALAFIETLREQLAKTVISLDGSAGASEMRVTVSIGVACFYPDAKLFAVMTQADKALYEAKNSGRNRVVDSRIQKGAEVRV